MNSAAYCWPRFYSTLTNIFINFTFIYVFIFNVLYSLLNVITSALFRLSGRPTIVDGLIFAHVLSVFVFFTRHVMSALGL